MGHAPTAQRCIFGGCLRTGFQAVGSECIEEMHEVYGKDILSCLAEKQNGNQKIRGILTRDTAITSAMKASGMLHITVLW
jgi:hypothetical protein